jgi:hypothetical protein
MTFVVEGQAQKTNSARAQGNGPAPIAVKLVASAGET